MRLILTYLLISTVVYLATNDDLYLEWSETDARWDCVVGISVDDKVIGSGVYIGMETVLTSANVVENYVDKMSKLIVHSKGLLKNESVPRTVGCIVSVFGTGRHRKKSPFWVQHGPQEDKENSPLHDLYTLSLNPLETDLIDGVNVIAVVNKGDNEKDVADRYPFVANVLYETDYIETDHYMWAGFGFIDKEHIQNATWLEMEEYGWEEVLEDCDEWIPREWGRFICIRSEKPTVGVVSGAPLFFRGRLVGIGSFMVEKNVQRLLVFTDLRAYLEGMQVCANMGRVYNTSELEHAVLNYSEIWTKDGKDAKRLAYV